MIPYHTRRLLARSLPFKPHTWSEAEAGLDGLVRERDEAKEAQLLAEAETASKEVERAALEAERDALVLERDDLQRQLDELTGGGGGRDG